MAAGKLYPPIIDYSMPAFALDDNNPEVRIYFALSSYNTISDVQSVHVTVRYLDSNENALGSSYPAKIKVSLFEEDETRVTRTDKYYITLKSSDLAKGFQTGVIYKIQLRFSEKSLGNSGTGPKASWFNDNYLSFSEWSTVALIRPISAPQYTILGLEEANQGAAVNFASADSVFTITYSQGESSEPLKQWRGRLYDSTKTTLLADSGDVVYSNYSYLPVDDTESVAFDCILPYQMEVGTQYILQLDLVTRNGYKTGSDFVFTCYPSSGTDFEGDIDMFINEEEAYAEIYVTSNTNNISNNLVIRRSSSESNFTIWEDMSIRTFNNETVDWTFRDFTIESGVWYRYGVQTINIRGHRGALVKLTGIKMAEFEDAFLLEEGGRQLKLRYDFSISNANITVAETKTDTIGSKFPFVRRNGNMYYRTFQCTGLITGYMDQNAHLFTTEKELYHGEQSRYNDIRNNINSYVNSYDYTYEREFREKVQEFLYNDKVKLFKSLQEGNILVKLMNISLTPKNELGRLLYTFSAQAIEIDEPSITNLSNYKLQPIGIYANSINYSESRVGQATSYSGVNELTGEPIYSTTKANQNLVSIISTGYGWTYNADGSYSGKKALNDILTNDFRLTALRIEFEDDPYLIERNGSSLTPFTGDNTSTKDLILGWLLSINGETILVQPPNNIYELKDDDLIISSTTNISLLKDGQVSLAFGVQLDEELNAALTPLSTTFYKKNGQLYRVFKPNQIGENIINLLKDKYSLENEDRTEVFSFDALFTADIEAEPGTILYARSSLNDTETKFIMNETGNLFLDPGISGINIASLRFDGKQIDIRYLDPLYFWAEKIQRDGVEVFDTPEYHYTDTDNTQSNPAYFIAKHEYDSKPTVAHDYDYYIDSESNQLFMYYNREWYPCVQINDFVYEIQCPVTAIVNYSMQQRREVFSNT